MPISFGHRRIGDVTLVTCTGRIVEGAESAALREILDELLLGAKDFFASRSLEQLAEAQGVHPLTNPKELAGRWPNDENVDEFVEAIYESRG